MTADIPVTWQMLGSFVVTCAVIELTPGPNMGYLALLAARSGRRAGLAATAGIALGLLGLGIAVALGLATLLANSPTAYEILRWSGVGYLLWLAWEGWRDSADTSAKQATDLTGHAAYFRRGLITNVLNPKAALFFVGVLPQFVEASRGVISQTTFLSIVYVLIASTIHGSIVMLAGAAHRMLERGERMRSIGRGLSVVLGCIALWLAYATRR